MSITIKPLTYNTTASKVLIIQFPAGGSVATAIIGKPPSAEVYYEEAEELLSKGDLVQACEKYYKAAEEAIKLLVIENNLKEIIKETQENGWDSKTLNDAVTELSYKMGDDIIYMWASAVTLFTARKYLDKDLIEEYKKDVETLIEKANAL